MRLDLYLVSKGFASSRTKAQHIIESGRVEINGKSVLKSSYDVEDTDFVFVSESNMTEFVGRGGIKLEECFNRFDLSVTDKICVDIGASTGGFTQCLLIHGAKRVYAVDSGKNQLDELLRKDDRVVSVEGFNARNLVSENVNNDKIDVVVMDVSFISQKLLYPAILNVASKGADVITLIKPQFEAGRQNVGKNGIVKSEKVRLAVVDDIIKFAESMGFEYVTHIPSPIDGGDGNKEFLLHLKVK